MLNEIAQYNRHIEEERKKKLILYRVIRFLKRNWYKLAFYEGRSDNRNRGKFKVLYDDGRMSENMCWKVANDYAEMFKGKVLDSF